MLLGKLNRIVMYENIYKNKKVLITGHTGFKGSWLATWLLQLGAKVYGYSIDIPSQPSHFENLGLEEKMVSCFGDVRKYDEFKAFTDKHQPEVVFHLAAQPIVRRSFADPLETIQTNVMGVTNILEITRNADYIKSLVIITSDKCYENVEWTFGYRENDQVGGEDPYSASKGAAEIIASTYMRSYFKDESVYVSTVRAGNVIGGGDWAKDRLIPDAVRAWSKLDPLVIRNPKATRPWQHVLEPLSGYLLVGAELIKRNSLCKNQSFNFGPDSTVNKTVVEVLREMSKSWGNVNWKVETDQNNNKEAGLLKLCCDKAHHYIKWYPTLSFVETIEFTMKWYGGYYDDLDNFSAAEITQDQIDKYCEIARLKNITWAQK
jgi:CDP-glucose 4,6-dehydratase